MADRDRKQTIQAAQQLVRDRVKFISTLVDARQRADDLQEQARAAAHDADVAYRNALDVGWTEQDLTKLGLTTTATPVRTKRRSATTAPRQNAPATAAVEPQPAHDPAPTADPYDPA